jgi:hypothetical protein
MPRKKLYDDVIVVNVKSIKKQKLEYIAKELNLNELSIVVRMAIDNFIDMYLKEDKDER